MIHPKSRGTSCTRLMLREGEKKSNAIKQVLERENMTRKRGPLLEICAAFKQCLLLFLSPPPIQQDWHITVPDSKSDEISDRTVKRCKDRWIRLVNQTDHQWLLHIWDLLLHNPKCFFLSHGTWLAEPWWYSGPYLSSSVLQFRQSSMPLRLFPWQLPWQQPPLDQPPIHGMKLEWPLRGSVKRTNVDKEIKEDVTTS